MATDTQTRPRPAVRTRPEVPDLPEDHAAAERERGARASDTVVEVDRAAGQTTFDRLMSKPRRVVTVKVVVDGDGEDGRAELEVKLRALGGNRYDELLEEHPPTKAQRANGDTYDIDSFAPALLAATMVEPAITVEQATALWTNEDWATGERFNLFFAATSVCQSGLNVPFNAAG